MKKVKDQISDVLYERLSSPFAQSFAIAWIVVNRELILYLFTSGNVEFAERIVKIDEYLTWDNGVVYPVLYAFASIIIYVLASWGAHNIWELFIVQKQNTRGRVRKYKKMDEEDEKRLREMIQGLQDELYSEKEKFDSRISSKQSEIDSLVEVHKKEVEIIKDDFNGIIDGLNNEVSSLKSQDEKKLDSEQLNTKDKPRNKRDIRKKLDDQKLTRDELESHVAFRSKNVNYFFEVLNDKEIESILENLRLIKYERQAEIEDRDIKTLFTYRLIRESVAGKFFIADAGNDFIDIALKAGY